MKRRSTRLLSGLSAGLLVAACAPEEASEQGQAARSDERASDSLYRDQPGIQATGIASLPLDEDADPLEIVRRLSNLEAAIDRGDVELVEVDTADADTAQEAADQLQQAGQARADDAVVVSSEAFDDAPRFIPHGEFNPAFAQSDGGWDGIDLVEVGDRIEDWVEDSHHERLDLGGVADRTGVAEGDVERNAFAVADSCDPDVDVPDDDCEFWVSVVDGNNEVPLELYWAQAGGVVRHLTVTEYATDM